MSKDQREALDRQLRSAPEPTGPQTVDEMRTGFAGFMSTLPISAAVRRTRTEIAGRPAVLVEPTVGRRTGTILYFHGGWFVLGSPDTAMTLTASLVERTGFSAVSLDYRLAPEHPFPAAIHDGLAAYRALLDSGADPRSIAFAGDSAGGGLTVTTALAARDEGLPLPGAIVAFSPALDHTFSGDSMRTKQDADPLMTTASIAHASALYLGGADPHQPLLAPAVLADLRGFPPMLVQVGTNEMLLDDSVMLAGRARDAEVDVTLDVTGRVPHVYQAFADRLDEGGEALDRVALFLRQRLTTGGEESSGPQTFGQ